jgi:TPR repeat protein
MRYVSAITLLILALAVMPPATAQNFEPNYAAGEKAWFKYDFATALKHFKPLAEQGHASAQFWLGQMYQYEQGVAKDYKEAIRWYRLAAKRGNSAAQRNLGWMYSNGVGVLQDLVMAYVMYNLSATDGNSITQQYRDELRAKLNTTERELALKLATLCFQKPENCPLYSVD